MQPMIPATPLPDILVQRHKKWRSEMGPEFRARLDQLATEGQSPPAMMVACCDSRVMAVDLFGSEPGELFVHRNIANLVPPYSDDDAQRGTSATVEFAVTALKVRHLIVMGHYACGGVAACLNQVTSPDHDETADSFISTWLKILAPRVPKVLEMGLDPEETLRALEREAILMSLENLMTFPFVAEALEKRELELHGIWNNIRDGVLEYYDPHTDRFIPVR